MDRSQSLWGVLRAVHWVALIVPFLLCPLVDASESDATVDSRFANLEMKETPSQTFMANALELIHSKVTVVGMFFDSTHESWRIVRGNYRHPVRYPDFFRMAGRPDLATRLESKMAVANTLGWVGIGTGLTGIGIGIWGIKKDRQNLFFTGLGIAAAGGLLWTYGGRVSDPGASEKEAEELVDLYNRALANLLGTPSVSSARPKHRWAFLPVANEKGVGLLGWLTY